MRRKGDGYPTVYCRGTLKIVGNTDTDRACMESDNKRYWRYKILMAIATILMSLGILIKALYPFFK